MWGHYSSSHSGYCIGFHEDKLTEYLSQKFKNNLDIHDVQYTEKIPEVDLSKVGQSSYAKETVIVRSSTKYSDWSYEKEKRFLIDGFSNQPLKIPSNIFKKLIFGYNADPKHIEEIIKICDRQYPEIKYYKAKPSLSAFEMVIKKYTS